MSYQAMEAVQTSSQYGEDTPENFAPFKIMLAIARYADPYGIAGVAGESRKCPSVRTLAKVARVHRNTVLNWLPQLVASGEITMNRGGAGRGSWTVYAIQLPIDPASNGTRNGTSPVDNSAEMAQGMAHQMAELAQEMAQLRHVLAQGMAQEGQGMAQGNGTNGTSPSTENCQIQDTEIQEDTEIPPDPPRDPVDLSLPIALNWPDIMDSLKDAMTEATFSTHLAGTTAVFTDNTVVVTAKNQLSADWINGRLTKIINTAIQEHTGQPIPVFARPAPMSEKEFS